MAAPAPAGELDRGRAGASAHREYLRRKRNREARIRRRHPLIGGLLLALGGGPQHEVAFQTGQVGEELVARSLQRGTAKGRVVILHDRRMPHGRGNIDHLAVAPSGVYVIDAKNINGRVSISRPLFGQPKLKINRRNRRGLVDGLDRQVAAVRRSLAGLGHAETPVHSVFCFTKAELPLFGAQIRGHRLHHRRRLVKRLNSKGPLTDESIAEIARGLAAAFGPA
ncbi:MAG TPA: nuclease-related domain-containing protein [Solirubrobacteraceae bacterium]|nr:nuclease-related domain-containing protein [Solirubrobacteraceae bacterium]